MKLLNNQGISSSDKKDILKKYIKKLSEFQYLIQDLTCKTFLEKKIEVKKSMGDLLLQEPSIIDIADKLREIFPYLMEI